MKEILMVLVVFLLVNVAICYSWCYCLDNNQKIIKEKLNKYQQENYERNEIQDKEIRLINQDILILQEDWHVCGEEYQESTNESK